MSEEIGPATHLPVMTVDDDLVVQDGKIIVQNKSTGELLYVPMTDEICNIFNLTSNINDVDETVEPHADVEENAQDDKMWTGVTILYLLDKIEAAETQFENGVKKHVWTKIAADCSKQFNKVFSYKQVETKWKSLKRTYRSILIHNKTSGKNRRNWEYFNKIHNFMHKKPEISPEATCSSSEGLKVASTSTETSKDEETDSNSCSSFTKKRKARQSEVLKRHDEKMQRLDRFNDLFEQMINKM